jgi:hypothetical protein
MLSLGLGLGLTMQRGGGHSPEQIVRKALKERKRLKAKHDGANVVLEPYALYKTDAGKFVAGVVIYADDQRDASFDPQYVPLHELHGIGSLPDTFFPNWAFNPNNIAGLTELIAAVELVQYGNDGSEADPAASVSAA